jgi:hypothetical protein
MLIAQVPQNECVKPRATLHTNQLADFHYFFFTQEKRYTVHSNEPVTSCTASKEYNDMQDEAEDPASITDISNNLFSMKEMKDG